MQDIVFFPCNERIFAKEFETAKELKEFREKNSGIKVCHLLKKASDDEINEFKRVADFIGIVGGDFKRNAFAVQSKRIRFLFTPSCDKLDFDKQSAVNAKNKGVIIAVFFSDFLNANLFERQKMFKNYSMVAKLCEKAGAEFRVFSGARNENELRELKDLEEFKKLLLKKGD